MFTHTSKEPRLWRGWLKNGQSVELSRDRHGWSFGAGIHIHSNDADMGDRMLFLKFWRFTAVIPMGIVEHPWPAMDGPQWSAYASGEFGFSLRWGMWSKSFDWPWSLTTLHYQKQMPDGSWLSVFDHDAEAFSETHPYLYVLESSKEQRRTATVSKRRHVLTYRVFKDLGWPRWNKESIEVEFDDEVGERSGSWKGGCIGCGYDLQTGESMEQCLRRMERERTFR